MEDLANFPGLVQRGQRGTWQCRIAVPANLRAIIRKRELGGSLKTADLSTAKQRYHHAAADAERTLARARASLAGEALPEATKAPQTAYGFHKPSRADYPGIVAAHREQVIEAEFDRRSTITEQAKRDPDAFYRGKITKLPTLTMIGSRSLTATGLRSCAPVTMS
jgi:hypothetical protein